MREAWIPLANAVKLAGDTINAFRSERLFYCKDTVGQKEVFRDSYAEACNKVSEITGIRALVRTEPDGETRSTLVVKALTVIKDLGADIPIPLKLRLDKEKEK